MPRRKVKIEFEDEEGGRYTISLERSLSRDKVLKIMDMVELLGGGEEEQTTRLPKDTTFGRLYNLIETKFPLGNFTSTDLLEAYEDEYNQPIKLSTISTYLSRFADRGLLTRHKTHLGWSYRRSRLNMTR